MKKALIIALSAFAVLSLGSCQRYYNCECTTYTGKVVQEPVQASNRLKANDRCDALGQYQYCEVK